MVGVRSSAQRGNHVKRKTLGVHKVGELERAAARAAAQRIAEAERAAAQAEANRRAELERAAARAEAERIANRLIHGQANDIVADYAPTSEKANPVSQLAETPPYDAKLFRDLRKVSQRRHSIEGLGSIMIVAVIAFLVVLAWLATLPTDGRGIFSESQLKAEQQNGPTALDR